MERRSGSVRAAIALAAIALCVAATPARTTNDAAVAKAREIARATVDQHKLPGLAVAVARDGKIVWAEGFGYADVEKRVPATPETLYRVGSLSKLVAAAALARLVEQRRIDLDAPIQTYVPAFPKKAHAVTPRQLAGHTSGIRHYAYKDFVGAGGSGPSAVSGLDVFKDDPLEFEPGTKYLYSSYGYFLLGAAIEKASGKSLDRFARDEVLAPAGATATGAERAEPLSAKQAVFYVRDGEGALRATPPKDAGARLAAGGFLSSAVDMARFASAHLAPGLFKKETLAAVFAPQKLASGESTGVGIGWRIAEGKDGGRIFHHGGSMEGCRAFLLVDERSKVAVALLTNLQVNFGEPEARAIAALFE